MKPFTVMTAEIVVSYIRKNKVTQEDMTGLIHSVHQSLAGLSVAAEPVVVEKPLLKPATPISKSITPGHIFCLEDGKRFKSLKRHLRHEHDLSPALYRTKWGLPSDYPMVAPDYAKRRSELARENELGRKPGR